VRRKTDKESTTRISYSQIASDCMYINHNTLCD